jgi:hypothetical protein
MALKKHNPQKKWNPPALPLEATPWTGNGNHWQRLKNCYTSVVCVILRRTVPEKRKVQLHSTRNKILGLCKLTVHRG